MNFGRFGQVGGGTPGGTQPHPKQKKAGMRTAPLTSLSIACYAACAFAGNVTAYGSLAARGDMNCAGGGDGDYSAVTRNIVASSNQQTANGLNLPSGFYDGVLAMSASPAGLAKSAWPPFPPLPPLPQTRTRAHPPHPTPPAGTRSQSSRCTSRAPC